MNLVDILIWVVLLIFAVKGFKKGLVREVCSLLGLAVGGLAAFFFYHPLAEILRSHINLPLALMSIISFVLIFLTLGFLFFFLGHLLTSFFKIILLDSVNRLGGVFFGVTQAAFVLCVLLSFGTSKIMPVKVKASIGESATAKPLLACGKEILLCWKTVTDKGEENPSAGRKRL
jgi:membrane protein required for colicin V production